MYKDKKSIQVMRKGYTRDKIISELQSILGVVWFLRNSGMELFLPRMFTYFI